MLSSPRSMKRSTSSIRMSPSCLRLAPATRSITCCASCCVRSLTSICDLRHVDRTAHPRGLGDHLAAFVLPGFNPPQRELADHAAERVRDHLGAVGIEEAPPVEAGPDQVEQAARELGVEELECGVGLQRLPEED